jgi:phenylalanyl-tRNA synthetase beta chain
MNIPADITEEVARIYGYDNITPLPLLADVQNVPYNKQVALIRNLEDFLVRDFGAQQTETYPWISEKTIKEFDKNPENFYSIKNPTNPEAPYLRDNMLYGLLAHTSKNSKFFDQFTIFDIGRIWDKSEKHEVKKATYASEFVQEQGELGVIIYQKDISSPTQDPVLKAKSFVDYLLK